MNRSPVELSFYETARDPCVSSSVDSFKFIVCGRIRILFRLCCHLFIVPLDGQTDRQKDSQGWPLNSCFKYFLQSSSESTKEEKGTKYGFILSGRG